MQPSGLSTMAIRLPLSYEWPYQPATRLRGSFPEAIGRGEQTRDCPELPWRQKFVSSMVSVSISHSHSDKPGSKHGNGVYNSSVLGIGNETDLLTRAMAQALSADLQAAVRSSHVLVVGTGGIGCELLKNLMLTGFNDISMVK